MKIQKSFFLLGVLITGLCSCSSDDKTIKPVKEQTIQSSTSDSTPEHEGDDEDLGPVG